MDTTVGNMEMGDPVVQKKNLTYGIDDNPPWYLSFFMAIQHYLTMIGAIVSIPFILTPALCMEDENPARGTIICTMIFVTGLVTIIQATWGCRLPLVQGGTISFLVPTLAILSLEKWRCPDSSVIAAMEFDEKEEMWKERMRELSGAIMLSSLFQVIIGGTGLVGKFAVKIITPLTIVPTVGLVGLTLFDHAAETASTNWGIAVGTSLLLTLFSQIMVEIKVPVVTYRKSKGFQIIWFELFKLFPVFLSIMIMWLICLLLTWTNVFQEGDQARTDVRLKVLTDAPWFRVPYPFQFGWPTFTVSAVLGMLAGVLACTVESLSYYPLVARMCDAAAPPVHVMNRGILLEGIGCILAGMWGSGNGTNTFGENVGAIGVTKIGSRRVILWASVIMMIQGVFGKLGAIFILIPDPVVGGMFLIMFGMITAFGISALQYVDLKSSRNLYIIGVSLFFPLVLCPWMQNHPGSINTGIEVIDSTLSVLLGTSILVGGALGCLLDHIVPGTDEERGVIAWALELELKTDRSSVEASTYDFPYGMDLLKKIKWSYYIPFSPTYGMKRP
ncbi:CLUMA_CG001207, isoform A [Clunio marinus]|uniref:CLUMA_CG001207, isoform A n=1 Tax=Clunio marinus TaxID=568069 RepID=A0A1J1HHC5_9DIPT|nr:CLUMA_CG001207, isoform A [Clunio marinus]